MFAWFFHSENPHDAKRRSAAGLDHAEPRLAVNGAQAVKRSLVMLPIPSMSKVKHLDQNVAAAGIALTDEEFADLST